MSSSEDPFNLLQLLDILNCPKTQNIDRQRVQSQLLSIQRDSTNWTLIPGWLSSHSVQVQFFGVQCLIIRINRDWDGLEEEEQMHLRQLISSLLTQDFLGVAAKNKLEEALVRVMEKAFISGWWKDPIGDLLSNSNFNHVNYNLLALIPSISTDSSSNSVTSTKSYTWHHEIKSHSDQVIKTLLSSASQVNNSPVLNCIKTWTNFGAFNFGQIEKLLPTLQAKLFQCSEDEEVEIEEIVDVLVEICELASRDPSEEARKAQFLLPICLKLASYQNLDPSIVTKLSASLTEECANYLVQSCHEQQIQCFLGLLLKLTSAPGIVGVDDSTSSMTLNAWYLLTEAIDSEIVVSNAKILISLLGNSLTSVLLVKATFPTPDIWSKLQKDLQQQFLQLRREFLDTLLYIQRALKTVHAPTVILDLIHHNLKELSSQPSSSEIKSHIETRLRALIIVAEEEDFSFSEDDVEDTGTSHWSPAWQNLASLIFASPSITHDSVNSKLAISLIGSLLPLMKGTSASDEAVKMLLTQLHSNPSVREECLGALQQAADAEVTLLTNHQVINDLLNLLSIWDINDRPQLIKLLSRLISDLNDESQRWSAFNALIQACMPMSNSSDSDFTQLTQVLKTPFTFKSEFLQFNGIASPYQSCLNLLQALNSNSSGEALLAAWLTLSGSDCFALFVNKNSSDPWCLINSYLSCPFDDSLRFTLGMKLLAAWVYGMAKIDSVSCLSLLENATSSRIIVIPDPSEDALEALIDAWIYFIKIRKQQETEPLNQSYTASPCILTLQDWTLHRISNGQLSVPLLRSLTRFLCILIEFNILVDNSKLFSLLQVIFSVGISGKIGRTGMEILSRILYDISLQHFNFFRSALNQLSESFVGVNLNDRRAFLRNLGGAHTIKKFKMVLVDFCVQARGLEN